LWLFGCDDTIKLVDGDKMILITKKQARDFLVKYHGFDKKRFKGKEGVLDFIKQVGCIQYDPLNVVGRNPDLVLQARIKNYKPKYLYDLLYKDRELLDGWDKQMSIYPVSDYSYFYSEFYLDSRLKSIEGTLRRRGALDALNYINDIKLIVDKNGPTMPRDINVGAYKRSGSWGHGRVSSIVMDYMYNRGELIVDHKKGVQKVYDLAYKKLPETVFNPVVRSEEELIKWHVKRRVASLGLVWNKGGGAFLESYLRKKEIRTNAINQLLESNELTEVVIEGVKEKFYLLTKDLDLLLSETKHSNLMSFVAPLDNMIWDRKMVDVLFNFTYSWEVYVPAAKRKYGYYILPVLYKGQLIARFEPIIDKENNLLIVKNWWYEDGVKVNKSLSNAKEKALRDFAKYLEVDYFGGKPTML